MSLATDIRYAAHTLAGISQVKAKGGVFLLRPPEGVTVEESCRFDVGVFMRLLKVADKIEKNMERLVE